MLCFGMPNGELDVGAVERRQLSGYCEWWPVGISE